LVYTLQPVLDVLVDFLLVIIVVGQCRVERRRGKGGSGEAHGGRWGHKIISLPFEGAKDRFLWQRTTQELGSDRDWRLKKPFSRRDAKLAEKWEGFWMLDSGY